MGCVNGLSQFMNELSLKIQNLTVAMFPLHLELRKPKKSVIKSDNGGKSVLEKPSKYH